MTHSTDEVRTGSVCDEVVDSPPGDGQVPPRALNRCQSDEEHGRFELVRVGQKRLGNGIRGQVRITPPPESLSGSAGSRTEPSRTQRSNNISSGWVPFVVLTRNVFSAHSYGPPCNEFTGGSGAPGALKPPWRT